MKPVRNWRAVLRYAWSIRLMLLAGLLSGAEVVLPLLDGILPIPPRLFALLTFFTVGFAFVARLVAQKGISDEK
jgi:hypothetical protein